MLRIGLRILADARDCRSQPHHSGQTIGAKELRPVTQICASRSADRTRSVRWCMLFGLRGGNRLPPAPERTSNRDGGIAQLVLERPPDKREVGGSSPPIPTSLVRRASGPGERPALAGWPAGAGRGDIAQLGEHRFCKAGVVGSSPTISTIHLGWAHHAKAPRQFLLCGNARALGRDEMCEFGQRSGLPAPTQ